MTGLVPGTVPKALGTSAGLVSTCSRGEGLRTPDLIGKRSLPCSWVPGALFPPRFIEEKSSFEYGQVNHALAAAMRTLVKEYLILVTQLEQLQRQGLLSLQKLWFYIQPAMRTVDILASLGTFLPPSGRTGQPWEGLGAAGRQRAGMGGHVLWWSGPWCVKVKPPGQARGIHFFTKDTRV